MKSLLQTSIIGLVSLLATVACSPAATSFQELSSQEASQSVSSTPSGEDQLFETSLEAVTQPLDLVWIVDNSGSMSQEIAHVRANFERFANSVLNRVDLRLALISQAGNGTYALNLGLSGSQYLQINQAVGSTNALNIAGSALCRNTAGACSSFNVSGVRGRLFDFLRTDSKKVFVVVSDDNSALSGSSFLSVFNQAFPGQTPTMFGFVGLGATASPCQANTGSVYINLARQLSGQVYNICDADWSSTFDELAERVSSLALKPIVLPQTATRIVSVTVNGQMLSSSLYSLTSEGVVLDAAVGTNQSELRISIVYRID